MRTLELIHSLKKYTLLALVLSCVPQLLNGPQSSELRAPTRQGKHSPFCQTRCGFTRATILL